MSNAGNKCKKQNCHIRDNPYYNIWTKNLHHFGLVCRGRPGLGSAEKLKCFYSVNHKGPYTHIYTKLVQQDNPSIKSFHLASSPASLPLNVMAQQQVTTRKRGKKRHCRHSASLGPMWIVPIPLDARTPARRSDLSAPTLPWMHNALFCIHSCTIIKHSNKAECIQYS